MNLLKKIWHWVRWALLVLVLAYIGLVLYRIPAVAEQQKTDAAVQKIHSQKITLADVTGTNLPPPPDKAHNDATVAGIDKNNNGIRDDVELWIFSKYPNSAKIRAAELQYAMTEQMYFTQVFNTETWKAVAEENSRANICLTIVGKNFIEVRSLVLNTQLRKDEEEKIFDFITSHGPAKGEPCDVSA
ncbi:MAG: hypothetical protein KGI70_01945 [Patescibacteria group bacterium]|nr:hypothetical protein [Patescibacteria group bacterium]